MKRSMRWLIAWVLYYSGFLKLWRRVWSNSGPIVLAYHRVLDAAESEAHFSLPSMIVSVDSFRKQVEYLKEHYEIVSLGELVRNVKEGARLRNLVVITFDDGWRDNYTNAYPVLLQYGVPATVFLVTDYVGTTRSFWPERLIYVLAKMGNREIPIPESMRKSSDVDSGYLRVRDIDVFVESLKHISPKERESIIAHFERDGDELLTGLEERKVLLGWDEVKEMAENGISSGAHTQTHPIVTQIPIDNVREEIVNSKMEIEKHLKRPCISFAYPNGDWNEPVRRLVMENGYDCACSLDRTYLPSGTDLYSLRRRVIHEGFAAGVNGKFSKCVFAAQIAGFFDSLASIAHRK